MKSKSLIAILLTLIIGIVIGILSSTYMRNRRMEEFRSYASFEGFRYQALRVIDPTEEQQEKILPVIEEFSRKNQELKIKYREEFIALMKDYKNKLEPLLTKEQMQRIENRRHQGPPNDRRGQGRERGERRRDGSGPPLR